MDAGEERFDAFLLPSAAFLLAALVFGGSSFDLEPALWLNLAALPLLLISFLRLTARQTHRIALGGLLVFGFAILIALAQLVPLSPVVWTRLSGRDLVVEVYRAAELSLPHLPISLDPGRTWRSLANLAPPLAMFSAALTLHDGARRGLGSLALAVGLASVTMAMVQKAAGSAEITGMFANRNHQGALLAACLPLTALVTVRPWASRGQRAFGWIAAFALAFVLLVGALVTTSRAALILIPIGGLGAVATALAANELWEGRRSGTPLIGLVAAICAGATLVLAAAYGPVAERLQGGLGQDLRFTLAPLVARAGGNMAPWGSGLGTFPTVYPIYETDASIGPAYVNHAHNEALEIWLEGGWFGAAALLAGLGWTVAAVAQVQGWTPGPKRATAFAGATILTLLLVHSLVDYPLRTPALAVLAGLAASWLVETPERVARERRGSVLIRSLVLVAVAAPMLTLWAWLVLGRGLSDLVAGSDPVRSLRWNPRNDLMLSALAERDFGRSAADPALRTRAEFEARAALTLAPLDTRAIRVLALAMESRGDTAAAGRLMRIGGKVSRRDDLTLEWLLLDDIAGKRFDSAFARADLALRQRPDLETILFPLINDTLSDDRAIDAMAERLAQRPGWRPGYLRVISSADPGFGKARRLYAALRATAHPPTVAESTNLVSQMTDHGLFPEAHEEWLLQPGVKAGTLLYDGDFKGLPGGTPFNWRIIPPEQGAGAEALTMDDGGGALRAVVSSGLPQTLAEQTLLLPPGAYQLTGRMRGAEPSGLGGNAFRWLVVCQAGARGELAAGDTPPAGGEWATFSLRFRAPEGCGAVTIRLTTSPEYRGGFAAGLFKSLSVDAASVPAVAGERP